MNQSPSSKPSSQKKCWNSITDKLTAKEIYSTLILSLRKSLTSQNYFENAFPNCTFDWTQIYLSLRIITITIKKLHLFGEIDSPLGFICHSNHEAVMHLFCECVRVSQLWSQLRIFCSTDLDLPLLMPQTAVFGFLAETDKSILKITNHLLLIFKMY